MATATASVSGPTTVTPGQARLAAAIDDAFARREQRVREERERAEFAAWQAQRAAANSRAGADRAQQEADMAHNNHNSGINWYGVGAVVGLILLAFVVIGILNWLFARAPSPQGFGNANAGGSLITNGAPTPGSQLPSNMVPGNWYATGNTKTVPSGTSFDTSPQPCIRNGVNGMCAYKKRGEAAPAVDLR